MRKNLSVVLIAFAGCLFFNCDAPPPQPGSSEAYWEHLGMIKESTLTKAELFNKALAWIAKTYNSANDVIQNKDPESGQIICNCLGTFPVNMGLTIATFHYTMIIDVKDNKIRTSYDNLRNGWLERNDNASTYKDKVIAYFTALNEGLSNAIKPQDKNW